MPNEVFDNVVKKLMKYKGKLIDVKKLSLLSSSFSEQLVSTQKVYKIVYYLKLRGYLENLKKNIFFVKDPDHHFTKDELLYRFYRTIVQKHCSDFLSGNWYIGGLKALELNLASYDIPDELSVVNQYKQATEVLMFDKQIIFKTYSKKHSDNLFKCFRKFTKKIRIGTHTFVVAGLELAILESLYTPSMIVQGYINELVKKVIRKYDQTLDTKVREVILKQGKHNTSINRLYMLAKTISPDLADQLKLIIKKYGYFI